MHPPLGFSHSQTYSSNTLSRALMLPDTCVRLFGSVTETVHDPTQCYKGDVIIFVLGMTGAGKSNIIDHLCGQQGVRTGPGLTSYTQDVSAVRIIGHIRYGDRIVLIDTPGFDDTDSEKSDLRTLQVIMEWMHKITMAGILYGIAFLHRISDNRMDGTKTRILELFHGLHGTQAAKNVVFVTTMWDSLNSDHLEDLERQLRDNIWKSMIDSGSSMMRFLNNPHSAWGILDRLYLNIDSGYSPTIQIYKSFEAYFVQPKISFLLLGATGVGKSTFINLAARKNVAFVSHSTTSSTSTVQDFEVLHPDEDKPLTCFFVDTPGFNHSDGGDHQILEKIVYWLESSRPDVRFGGIIYLYDISAPRLQAGFEHFVMLNLSHPLLLERLILVTTICDNTQEKLARAQRHEYELQTRVWKSLLDRKAQTLRFTNTTESAWDVVDHLLDGRKPVHTQLIHDELKKIHKILANAESNKEIDLSGIKGVFSSLMESTSSFFRTLLRLLFSKSTR